MPQSGSKDGFRPPDPPWWGKAHRLLLYLSFWALAKVRLRLYVRGLDHLRNLPGTIVLSTHKCHWDAVAILSTLLVRSGFRGPLGRVSVVGTEVLFEPGVLAGLAVRRPQWLNRLVYRVNLRPVMHGMRWYPIAWAGRRLLRSHLTDVVELLGDLPFKEVFLDPADAGFPSVPPDTPVGSVIQWAYRDALYRVEPFSVFRPEVEEVLRQRHRARIADSLAFSASLLDHGEAIAISPEGGRSRDGYIRDIKSGPLQILQQTQREAAVLPLNVTYDLMTTGRIRAFLAFGPPLHGVRDMDRDRYETEVIRALATLGTVTLGQVASRAIRRHAKNERYEIPEAELKDAVIADARSLADRGLEVDPLLTGGREFERRWNRFVAYCRREGLFERCDGILRFDRAKVLDESLSGRFQTRPWVFACNELESMLGASEGR